MRTRSILKALAVVLATFAGSTCWAQAPAGKPIRLGLIAEQTGPLAFYGAETARTAQLIVKQINDRGGLLGRPVELVVRDSKTTVNEAVRQARDLVYTENVDFLLQSINSAECVGVANVATQAKKIFISNCTNDDLTTKDGGKYVFRIMNITTRTQGYAAADCSRAAIGITRSPMILLLADWRLPRSGPRSRRSIQRRSLSARRGRK